MGRVANAFSVTSLQWFAHGEASNRKCRRISALLQDFSDRNTLIIVPKVILENAARCQSFRWRILCRTRHRGVTSGHHLQVHANIEDEQHVGVGERLCTCRLCKHKLRNGVSGLVNMLTEGENNKRV